MTQNDILLLAKAGFTAQQILALGSVNSPQVQPQVQPPVQPQVQPQVQPPVQPQVQPQVQPNSGDLIQTLKNLTGAIQATNLIGQQIQTVQPQSTDDIIAQMIAPPIPTDFKGGNK